jgi:hypothetical protein
MEPQSIQTISTDGWAVIEPAAIDDRSRYDLVVFDRVSGARLPGVPSLTFGGVPAGVGAVEPRDDFGQMILSWDRQHPVMRNLALDSIVFSGFGALRLPEVGATALAYGPEGPIMALIRTRGARHVVVGFAPGRSNWPLHVSSAMFVQNAVEYLTLASELGGAASGGLAYRPGEPIPVRAAADMQEIVVRGEGHTLRVPVASTAGGGVSSASSQATIPGISRAGVYSAAGALPPHGLIAVNVASDSESDIRPRESVTVHARPAQAFTRGSQQSKPLWPWLLAFAFVLAVIEWLAYCKRVR